MARLGLIPLFDPFAAAASAVGGAANAYFTAQSMATQAKTNVKLAAQQRIADQERALASAASQQRFYEMAGLGLLAVGAVVVGASFIKAGAGKSLTRRVKYITRKIKRRRR